MTRQLSPVARRAIRELRQAEPFEVYERSSLHVVAGCLAHFAAALVISVVFWLGLVALLLEVWR